MWVPYGARGYFLITKWHNFESIHYVAVLPQKCVFLTSLKHNAVQVFWGGLYFIFFRNTADIKYRVIWQTYVIVCTVTILKIYIFWDIMPCTPLKVNWRFGGTCCLHLQARRVSRESNQCNAGNKQSNQLAEILVYIANRRAMQDNKQVPIDSPIGQNEPIGVQEQLASSYWLSHTTKWTNRRKDQDNQCGPGKGQFVLA
jgi:hypothetical protein